MEKRSFARTSNVRRLCAGIVVALCLAFVSGLALAGGSGVYIPSSTRLEVYAVNGFSGPHDTGRTIHANHFP